MEDPEEDSEARESQTEEDTKGPDFNYLTDMKLCSCLTKERVDELLKQRDVKAEELRLLQRKTAVDLWKDDLENFLTELDVRIIHSFIPNISIAPLQVLVLLRGAPDYGSDTVPELTRELRVKVLPKVPTWWLEWAGFEPATCRTQGTEPTTEPPHSTIMCVLLRVNGFRGVVLFRH